MKSLERRFRAHKNKNPSLSDLTCFAEAVKEQGFNRRTLRQWMKVLVDPEEYQNDQKVHREVLTHLEVLSIPPRTTKKEGAFCS